MYERMTTVLRVNAERRKGGADIASRRADSQRMTILTNMEAKQLKLTIRQLRFCEEYVSLGNAVQAYFQAYGVVGITGGKRSYKSAARLSARLMAKPHVQAEVQAIQVAGRRIPRVRRAKAIRPKLRSEDIRPRT